MTLVELKKSIHQKIDDLKDRELLELINQIAHKKDDVFIIPDHMKKGIEQGKKDIINGNFFTMEDFEKKYEKWLKE
jgi:hypothetical protein